MRTKLTVVAWLLAGCAAAAMASAPTSAPADRSWSQAGPLRVGVVRYDWRDARRDRAVPAKVYYAEGARGPMPVIIYSHGLGGSREGYPKLRS